MVWKHVVWAGSCRTFVGVISRLAVTHPDGHGGLGFMGLYPAGYTLFTLAVSPVTAAGIGHVMQNDAVTPTLIHNRQRRMARDRALILCAASGRIGG